MSTINCLKCKEPIESELEACPHCNERVTLFQRTYAARLIDGKYQILDRLGLGGMGEIFKVRHIHLNELRVIKIMRPNVAADDQGLQRFLQEARTSTTIKHKNLAMLYDFSTLDDGSYYMVWEFIDGTNIQKWIAQNGPMPARLTIEIAIQALMGLDHLHSMGLIHRDISPENIMLSQDNKGKLLVKVIDFGIAKQLAEGESGQGLTQTGMFLGKLKYASPEQAGFLKEGEHLDARSDLYSFGIVMYEMVAGRAPFQATNPHGYILKHVTEKPLPISEINPAVKIPPKLESIIFRALEKSRDARYESAAAMAAELESIRNEVAPDQKYGLGERMVTLTGAKTLIDAPKPMRTGVTTGGTTAGATSAGRTVPAQRVGPTGTKVGGDEATVIERKGGVADEATVMERMGGTAAGAGAAPTVVERKGMFEPTAEPTVIEQKMRREEAPKKSAKALYGGIAAAVVLALALGGYLLRPKPEVTKPPVVDQSTGAITSTAANSIAPIAPGQGALLLSASPYGELEKIVGRNGKAVDIDDEKRSTPTRIDLPPGEYEITLKGPDDKKQTFMVNVKAGTPTRIQRNLGAVDYDQLQKDIKQQ
jgi:tRNA A-37 threonylcarbamoyl transferase component Bud32